jgi:hypothetical protein
VFWRSVRRIDCILTTSMGLDKRWVGDFRVHYFTIFFDKSTGGEDPHLNCIDWLTL